MQYAGFWIRVAAYLIDFLITAFIGGIIGMVFGVAAVGTGTDLSDPFGAANSALNLVSILVGVAYFAGLESSSWQGTIGKKAVGLVVTDMNGNRISFLRALGRYVGKFLSAMIIFIGFIMVGFTERKQGLHDMIASTLVLKGQPGMVGTNTEVFE